MAELSSPGPHYPSLPFTLWLGPRTLFCSLYLHHHPPPPTPPYTSHLCSRCSHCLDKGLTLPPLSSPLKCHFFKGAFPEHQTEALPSHCCILCTTLLTDQNDRSSKQHCPISSEKGHVLCSCQTPPAQWGQPTLNTASSG